jgi:hypothetical protein
VGFEVLTAGLIRMKALGDFTPRRLVVTDVQGRRGTPIFSVMQTKRLNCITVKMKAARFPEMSTNLQNNISRNSRVFIYTAVRM